MGCRVRAFWANVRTAVDPIRQEDPNPVLPLEKQFILAEDTYHRESEPVNSSERQKVPSYEKFMDHHFHRLLPS